MKTRVAIIIIFLLLLNSSFIILNSFAQWEPDVRLTNDPGYSYTSWNNAWCVAANGNIVHAVWYDERDTYEEIYYKRSTDGGINWGADTRLTNHSGWSENPSIAVSGSLVHVVWADSRDGNEEIYYKRSTDDGISWDSDTRLTNNLSQSGDASIAVFGLLVHVVWSDSRDGNYETYYKHSTDGGINWGEDTRLTNNIYFCNYPSIAVSGSNVHVVWREYHNNILHIYYKHSIDGGINWGADTCLTNNYDYFSSPSIAVSGSNVHVVWRDNRNGNLEIYYKRSTDGGIIWETDTRLTDNTADSEYPSIAVSGSNVHVVWNDKRDGNMEIYYKHSTSGGVVWSSDIRLTNASQYSQMPFIAVSGTLVHVVWFDGRNFNSEIYYKRNPTGNLTSTQNISTEIPSAFSLEQNYPNPFNPRTVIRYQLSVVSNVILKVYDINGKEMHSIVKERLQPGTYETTFDGSGLNSGVYFYRMSAGNYSETKKMIIVK
ncbi:MAG: exo-alpha-sialidase [Candidatus Kapaibacterium sp.]